MVRIIAYMYIYIAMHAQVLQETQLPEFQQVMRPLFARLSECIQSPNFLVAERVLFLWNNEKIVKLINHNRPVRFSFTCIHAASFHLFFSRFFPSLHIYILTYICIYIHGCIYAYIYVRKVHASCTY